MIESKGGIRFAKAWMSTIHKLGVGHYPQCKCLRTGDRVVEGIENLLPFYKRHKWRNHWDEYI